MPVIFAVLTVFIMLMMAVILQVTGMNASSYFMMTFLLVVFIVWQLYTAKKKSTH